MKGAQKDYILISLQTEENEVGQDTRKCGIQDSMEERGLAKETKQAKIVGGWGVKEI